MGRGKTKPITFRPTEKALAKIKATIQQKEINRNQAINILLETKQSQLEHPKEGENFFALPPFLWCPQEHNWFLKETLIEECRKCRIKSHCRAWNPR